MTHSRAVLRRSCGGPCQFGAGLAGIEFEVSGFVNGGGVVDGPGGVIAPALGHGGGDLIHGPCIVIPWTEVPGRCELRFSGEKAFGEREISGEGFEDVLPGPNGFWPADQDGFAGAESADEVGDEAIAGPVAASDDVARTSGGEQDAMPVGRLMLKERRAVRGADDLRASFAAAIGIVSAERICFAISPVPLTVLVALVRGDDDRSANGGRGRTDSNTFATPITLVSKVLSGSA